MKGIWNNKKLAWLSRKQCLLYSHLKDDGKFYSALARKETAQLGACLDFIRTNDAAFLFFAVEEIPFDAFDSYLTEQYSDLEQIVLFFFEKNTLLIRVSGNFDDRKLCVDFFGRRALLTKTFTSAMPVENENGKTKRFKDGEDIWSPKTYIQDQMHPERYEKGKIRKSSHYEWHLTGKLNGYKIIV